jgi:hypothetical protein
LIRLTPAIEAALVRYIRTERAKNDPFGRKRLDELDDCARSITRRFRLLDGEGQGYFNEACNLFVKGFAINCMP